MVAALVAVTGCQMQIDTTVVIAEDGSGQVTQAVGLDDADASIGEGRASVTWYPWRKVGIGAQYSYTKLEYKRDVVITELGGKLQYDGLQLMVSLAF